MATRLAETEEEYVALIHDPSRARDVITSIEDWRRFIEQRRDTGHPLHGVSDAAINEFTDNVVFRGGGLAHGRYAKLAEKLSPAQFARFWAAFGIGERLIAGIGDKVCDQATAKCEYRKGDFCLPSQCRHVHTTS